MEKKLRELFLHVWIDDNVMYGEKEPCDKFFTVYHLNYEFYFADHWAHVVDGMHVIRYSPTEMSAMYKRDFSKLQDLIRRINEVVKECYNEKTRTCAFVKLGSSSTKHDYPPEQVFNGEDAIQHLLGSDSVLRFLSCGVIIVRKWRDDITRFNEFRVFIKTHKVIGISQQFIYESIPFSYENVYSDMSKDIQQLWDNIKNRLEYKDAILDVWFDYDMKPQLIEINPHGPWTGAGSSLFHWIDDTMEKGSSEFRLTEWKSI
jgi:hypothetical protein